MPQVDVVLNGRAYPVTCGEGEEGRVLEVAAFIESRLNRIKVAAPHANEAHLLVLVSLLLGDELLDAKAGITQPPGSVALDGNGEMVAEAIAALADRVEAIVDRIDGP